MNMTIGDIVKRTTGACHEKGSTGQVIAIDEEKGRVQIKWIAYSDGEIFKAGQRSNTWMSCNALATI